MRHLFLPFVIAAAYFAAHPAYRFDITVLHGYQLVEPYHPKPAGLLLVFGFVNLILKSLIHKVVLQCTDIGY